MYGLDPEIAIFRVLRRLWDTDPASHPLLALLAALARDRLMVATARAILPLADGIEMPRKSMAEQLRATVGERLSDATLDKVIRNTASSWSQAGHLSGRTFKVRRRVRPHRPQSPLPSIWDRSRPSGEELSPPAGSRPWIVRHRRRSNLPSKRNGLACSIFGSPAMCSILTLTDSIRGPREVPDEPIQQLAKIYGQHIATAWQRTIADSQRVIMIVYDKELERDILAHKDEFEIATKQANHDWFEINVAPLSPNGLRPPSTGTPTSNRQMICNSSSNRNSPDSLRTRSARFWIAPTFPIAPSWPSLASRLCLPLPGLRRF